MANEVSTKRVAISRANAQMVIVVGVASFLTVFCLIASKAVLSQNQYQARVVKAKQTARNQLRDNISAFSSLNSSYKEFDSSTVTKNVIGGNPTGTGDNDGTNSKIILDALPSNYDFPALTSSLEKILTDRNLKVTSITGTDDQLNQQGNTSSPDPQAISIPFTFTVSDANYQSINSLISDLQRSIRPIQIDTLEISGGVNDMKATVNAHTYFQPAKSLTVTTKVVK